MYASFFYIHIHKYTIYSNCKQALISPHKVVWTLLSRLIEHSRGEVNVLRKWKGTVYVKLDAKFLQMTDVETFLVGHTSALREHL